jgi:SAM-dependent methyltransferase
VRVLVNVVDVLDASSLMVRNETELFHGIEFKGRNEFIVNVKSGNHFSYNGAMARWWMGRSVNCSHRRAYRKIADFIRDSYRHSPETIVDYACGAGNLLALLSCRFPNSSLIGLDGSSYLLGLALRRLSRLPRSCSRRISLIETALPNQNYLRSRADLVIFCFPNMMPFSDEGNEREGKFRLKRNDCAIAKYLDPKAPCDLERSRAISYNLRSLLIPGGICVRVEYATIKRHEFTPVELLRVSFEEGSLDGKVEGKSIHPWFRVQASAYFRSQVLEDVYEQTRDERDRKGGYLITVLRAV